MKPDAQKHNPDPEYIRSLIEEAGLGQRGACEKIGIAPRTMRAFLDPNDQRQAPYTVQFALEQLTADDKTIKALKPLADLDLTGVQGDIIYARNKTEIKVQDVNRANRVIESLNS